MRREAGRENRVSYLKRGRDVQKQGRGTAEKKKPAWNREERGIHWNSKDKKRRRVARNEKQEINLPSFSLSRYDSNLFYISHLKLFSWVFLLLVGSSWCLKATCACFVFFFSFISPLFLAYFGILSDHETRVFIECRFGK